MTSVRFFALASSNAVLPSGCDGEGGKGGERGEGEEGARIAGSLWATANDLQHRPNLHPHRARKRIVHPRHRRGLYGRPPLRPPFRPCSIVLVVFVVYIAQ